jgi:hypothetical protein
MIGANWAVTSAPRREKRLTHCNGKRILLSPKNKPETLENAKTKRNQRMTHQFTALPSA